VDFCLLQAVSSPDLLAWSYLRVEVLLGLLLPPQPSSISSSSSTGPGLAVRRHLFAEGAYDMVMEMTLNGNSSSSSTSNPQGDTSSSNSSLSWASGGSALVLHFAAVWHALMRAKARNYASYQDRYVGPSLLLVDKTFNSRWNGVWFREIRGRG
jgi:hypothetical protein